MISLSKWGARMAMLSLVGLVYSWMGDHLGIATC